MTIQLSSQQVWEAMEKEQFAVIGMVTANQESRTAGVLYAVLDHKLYISTGAQSWKARHIAANPHVSITVPIAKRILIMPWIKVPAATITFSGTARVFPASEGSPELLRAILGPMADNPEMVGDAFVIEVTPVKEFVTYGVGVPLQDMRSPETARGRAPVASQQ